MDDINWELFIYAIPRDNHVIQKLEEESFYQYARLCKRKGLPMPQPREEN
jgi:hypothetical protein